MTSMILPFLWPRYSFLFYDLDNPSFFCDLDNPSICDLDNPSFFVTVIMGITSYECSLYRSSKWRNMHDRAQDIGLFIFGRPLPFSTFFHFIGFCDNYQPLCYILYLDLHLLLLASRPVLSSGAAGTSYTWVYRRISTLLGVWPRLTVTA